MTTTERREIAGVTSERAQSPYPPGVYWSTLVMYPEKSEEVP